MSLGNYTVDIGSLWAVVHNADEIRLPEPVPAKDGAPGRDGERGKDGVSIDLTDVERMVRDAIAKWPVPVAERGFAGATGATGRDGKDGKDGVTVHGRHGNDGVNGRDGRDADPAVIQRMLDEAVARLPRPLDGKDGAAGVGERGPMGWSPVPSTEADGEQVFLRIDDWIGGAGQKPPTGYVGEQGITTERALATNIRGPRGRKGQDGTGGGGTGPRGEKGEPGTPGTGGDGTTSVIETVAHATLSGHRVVRSVGANEVDLADSTNVAHAGTVLGITLGAAVAGDPIFVAVDGVIEDVSFSFTPGPLYFDSIGRLTQAVPATGFKQQVAVVLSATTIVMQIGTPISFG
jgi:hypothetical protein